jgi:hypothetical protein
MVLAWLERVIGLDRHEDDRRQVSGVEIGPDGRPGLFDHHPGAAVRDKPYPDPAGVGLVMGQIRISNVHVVQKGPCGRSELE